MNSYGVFIFLFFAGATLLLFSLLESIPPHKITLTTMNILKERIMLYTEQEGKLPDDLSNLPKIPNKHNASRDAWGNEIIYKREDGNYEVVLISYGQDKKQGGIGRDTDLLGRFHPTDVQGNFLKGRVSWAQDPADFAPDYHTGY